MLMDPHPNQSGVDGGPTQVPIFLYKNLIWAFTFIQNIFASWNAKIFSLSERQLPI